MDIIARIIEHSGMTAVEIGTLILIGVFGSLMAWVAMHGKAPRW